MPAPFCFAVWRPSPGQPDAHPTLTSPLLLIVADARVVAIPPIGTACRESVAIGTVVSRAATVVPAIGTLIVVGTEVIRLLQLDRASPHLA
jgi:hypothetical protein